jgi:hypothetical protein
MIFQWSPVKTDRFIPVKFLLSTVIRKKLPLLSVRKHCIDGKVADINESVHLTSSYVDQTRVSNSYRLRKLNDDIRTFKYLCQEVPVLRATHDLQFHFDDQKHYHSFRHKHLCPLHWFLAPLIKTAKKQWDDFAQPLDNDIHTKGKI